MQSVKYALSAPALKPFPVHVPVPVCMGVCARCIAPCYTVATKRECVNLLKYTIVVES